LNLLVHALEEAEGQVAEVRKKETNSKKRFEKSKQSLEEEIANLKKGLERDKSFAASAEANATTANAEGESGTVTVWPAFVLAAVLCLYPLSSSWSAKKWVEQDRGGWLVVDDDDNTGAEHLVFAGTGAEDMDDDSAADLASKKTVDIESTAAMPAPVISDKKTKM